MESIKSIKYNGFSTKGGNHIWAAALGLAWNELIQKFIKQPIKVDSKDKNVNQIVKNFNQSKFSTKDIDEKCIYVKSGYGPQTVKQINQESRKKFPEKTFTDLEIELKAKDIISYAYLLKKLEFQYKFQRAETDHFLFNNKNVSSFHATENKQKQQIQWFYYKNQNEFMITVNSKNQNDEIYLIKDKNIQNVDEAIKIVQKNQKKAKNKLKSIDSFEMPVVELDVKRDVQELIGRQILNKALEGYIFGAFYEGIKLKIDEAGAKVENQAVIKMLKCARVSSPEEPKYFVLDKDFWIVMKQKNKNPYFCALISNPNDK